MQRHAVGVTAIVLIALGVWTYGDSESAVSGICLRIGAVLIFLWLALPQLQSVPSWLIGVLGVSLLVIMRWPKLLLAAVPLAAVLWFLRPRPHRRTGNLTDPRD